MTRGNVVPAQESGGGLNVRPVDRTTAPQARGLILEGLGEHFGFVDETRNPDLDDILANYVERGHEFLVGTLGGRVVCTGALVEAAPGIGRVVRMSVVREHRRQGLATLMLRRLTERAVARGHRRLLVETNHDWPDAVGLYRRFGFVEYDRDDESVHMAMEL